MYVIMKRRAAERNSSTQTPIEQNKYWSVFYLFLTISFVHRYLRRFQWCCCSWSVVFINRGEYKWLLSTCDEFMRFLALLSRLIRFLLSRSLFVSGFPRWVRLISCLVAIYLMTSLTFDICRSRWMSLFWDRWIFYAWQVLAYPQSWMARLVSVVVFLVLILKTSCPEVCTSCGCRTRSFSLFILNVLRPFMLGV